MNREAMLAYMPHRGRNVLIDEFEDLGRGKGRARLTVDGGDPLGRDLFLVRGPDGLRYSQFFLVEHAALCSVMILREEMKGGRLAYFSTISRFRARSHPRAGIPLVSEVRRGRDRREFRTFRASLSTAEGEPVLEVDFMAYLAASGARPEEGREGPRPGEFPPPAEDRFPCFAPSMVFVGGPDGEGRWGGVYPADHPLAEGHFPGAPVMMGMTQWLAVAQRAALGAPSGSSRVAASGRLAASDGRSVAEVSGLVIETVKDGEGRIRDLRLLGTKRVAFRDRILPGDAWVVEVTGGGTDGG